MNILLEEAFHVAATLSEVEQVALARRIFAELASEAAWDQRFANDPEVLNQMAKEALQEREAGETTPLDFQSYRRAL